MKVSLLWMKLTNSEPYLLKVMRSDSKQSAPLLLGKWAMSWTPQPAQSKEQQGNSQLNVTSAV